MINIKSTLPFHSQEPCRAIPCQSCTGNLTGGTLNWPHILNLEVHSAPMTISFLWSMTWFLSSHAIFLPNSISLLVVSIPYPLHFIKLKLFSLCHGVQCSILCFSQKSLHPVLDSITYCNVLVSAANNYKEAQRL